MSEVPQSKDMEEQSPHPDTADVKAEDRQSANEDGVSPPDERNQGETGDGDSAKEKKVPTDASSSPDESSTQTPEETDRSIPTQIDERTNGDSAKEKKVLTDASSSPDKSSTQTPEETVTDRSTPTQTDEGSQGDYKRVTEINKLQTMTDGDSAKEKKVPTDAYSSPDESSTQTPEETDRSIPTQTDERTNGDSAKEKKVPTDASSSPDKSSTQTPEETVTDGSTPTQTDEGSQGDYKRVTEINKLQTMTAGQYHTRGNKAIKTTTPHTLHDCKEKEAGGPNTGHNEEATGTNNANDEAGDNEGSCLESQENTTSPQDEEKKDEQKKIIETIGRTTLETEPGSFSRSDDGSDPNIQDDTTSRRAALPQDNEEENEQNNISPSLGGISALLILMCIMGVALAVLVPLLSQSDSPPPKDDVRQIFLNEMKKVKTQFPNQRTEVWDRSKIHLLRHLQTAQPTEPVSLILTAGIRAERTLHCLAKGLASAFSFALNASVLHIDGASKASQDSDQVKLDIDSKLQGAFEGDKPVAIIHRFEELPPGSTLIFYRYCDHENAAYKKTFLIFTVLLGEEEEIPAKSHLSAVEEMVDDHLQKKFLSDGQPVSFDRMDLDKYGGLWSRISHLILPVAAEKRMEHEGC